MEAFDAKELYSQSSFDLYGKRSIIFELFSYCFLLKNINTYTMNTLFTTEIIESIPVVRRHIENEQGVLSRKKIVLLRLLVWAVMVLLSLFARNVVKILSFSGSVFTPIVSYFGPVDCAH